MTDALRGAAPATATPPAPAPSDAFMPDEPARRRGPRRSPTELTVRFADEATVRAQSEARSEPDWLRDDRLAALAEFTRLPIESNVLYTTYVDLRNAELSSLGLASPALAGTEGDRRVSPDPAAARGDRREAPELPDGAAAIIALDQGGVIGVTMGEEATAAGLVLETLAEFGRRDAGGFRAAIEAADALPSDDKLAQLTRALWSVGVHVALPDAVRLPQPVVIRWTFNASAALLSRTVIELGEGAKLQVVEEIQSGPASGAAGLLTGTTEVRLAQGSDLSFASLQELSGGHVAFQHRTAAIGPGAKLRWALAQLGSRLMRSRVDNRLVGDGGSVEQVEIVFGSVDQLFDLTSYTRHLGRDATSNLLSKAVLQDSARTFLKGLVTIDKSGTGTDSFLGEYGMNLSKKARAVAIPSLEIDQPDCRRVMHSSSVGPIDESQLFYLESRGISPDDARKFIVLGFLEPVVARVSLASAQDQLREALEAKWDAGHEGPASSAA